MGSLISYLFLHDFVLDSLPLPLTQNIPNVKPEIFDENVLLLMLFYLITSTLNELNKYKIVMVKESTYFDF